MFPVTIRTSYPRFILFIYFFLIKTDIWGNFFLKKRGQQSESASYTCQLITYGFFIQTPAQLRSEAKAWWCCYRQKCHLTLMLRAGVGWEGKTVTVSI